MTRELKQFQFGDLNLGVIMLDGLVWYVAQDIANILEYNQTSDMTKRLDSDEKRNYTVRRGDVTYTNQTLVNVVGLLKAFAFSKKERKFEFLVKFLCDENLTNSFVKETEELVFSKNLECVERQKTKIISIEEEIKPFVKEPFMRHRRVNQYSLYVVLFDHGVIKVGKGEHAIKRVKEHAKQASIFDRHVVDFFIEENPTITEEALIKFCITQGTLCHGNEYFKDLKYDQVVNFVKRKVERKVLKLVR